jgi:hypothetical protein
MSKIILSKIYLFLESFALPFSRSLRERRKQRKKVVQDLCEDYNDLIVEYGLIQEKKSKLSRSQREEVIRMVHYLIDQGHITIQSK